ncbi:amino acid permease [Atopobacter sp. AH10]|uniref:APC family permease n=1 Tax=Atopobacter sp. AH10 TaxID=2315861 RepID=UPI000EF1BEDC|nr:amino acid permease [Atopobacter sp. AH10]RLK63989.1 amino acid permease [Atopobacter sp. AH10]
MEKETKKITWVVLAFMCFSCLWGFGNVANGYMFFDGVKVIILWLFMFAFYLTPYALMCGELGSAFKDSGGGVTTWVQRTTNDKLAYYSGWMYWAVHITYIASMGSGGLKTLSWIIFKNAEFYDSIPAPIVQATTLCVLLLFCWVASKGINPLKSLSSLAGTSCFVLSILFFVLMFAAPVINPNGGYLHVDLTLSGLMPKLTWKTLSNLSILVFAVGGIEKVSPYINDMKGDPAKEFPKSMIFAVVMVVVCAVFGTIALGMIYDPAEVNANFDSYFANGTYWAFQKLGQYYGVGNLFMIIYAFSCLIGLCSVMVISIDAPLRMLLDDPNASKYIPRKLLKQNKHGSYVNGIKLIVALCSSIIIAQMTVPGAATVLKQLVKLNSIIEPCRYLWIFYAYILLKKNSEKYPRSFVMTHNNRLGIAIAIWMLLVTAACTLMGMYSDDPFQLGLNIITPVVLFGLGLIFPKIRKAEDAKLESRNR